MPLKLLSKFIVTFGTLFIWFIKLVIRPYVNTQIGFHFFWGIAPNLLGSFCLIFGAFWFLEYYLFLLHSMFDIKMVLLFFFILLIINEYLQLISIFGRTFDWNDIAFSAIGLSSSYFVFSKYYKKHILTYSA